MARSRRSARAAQSATDVSVRSRSSTSAGLSQLGCVRSAAASESPRHRAVETETGSTSGRVSFRLLFVTERLVDVQPTSRRPEQRTASALYGRRAFAALVVVAALFAVRATAPREVELGDALQDFITLSTSVLIESLPFVMLGIGLSVVVQLWVPQRVLFGMLPRTPVLRRASLSLLGVLLPVCECGNVPLARGLVVRGVAVPDAITFLLAAPILNPITIVVTYQAFGFSDGILFWRVLGGFLIANFVGWLFSRHNRPEDLLTSRFQESCHVHSHPPNQDRNVQALRMFGAEASAILPALVVGCAVAGFIQVAVSRDLLLTLGQNPVWSVLALMGLAFVIAICSTVDAFFVLSLGSMFTPGAVIAFLVFGPMIDIKMLALLRTTFTASTLVLLTADVALLAAVLGLGVNLAL
jgi:uncharacterized protein